jgi:hypothetical protein
VKLACQLLLSFLILTAAGVIHSKAGSFAPLPPLDSKLVWQIPNGASDCSSCDDSTDSTNLILSYTTANADVARRVGVVSADGAQTQPRGSLFSFLPQAGVEDWCNNFGIPFPADLNAALLLNSSIQTPAFQMPYNNLTQLPVAFSQLNDLVKAFLTLENSRYFYSQFCVTEHMPTMGIEFLAADNRTLKARFVTPTLFDDDGDFALFHSFQTALADSLLFSHGINSSAPTLFEETAQVHYASSPVPLIEGLLVCVFFTTLLPLFVSRIATDTESNMFKMLELLGLSTTSFIVYNGATDIIVYFAMATLLTIVSVAFKLSMFAHFEMAIAVLVVINGLSTISTAYMLALISSSKTTAVTLAFVCSLLLPVTSVMLNLFVFVDSSPWLVNLIPVHVRIVVLFL